MAIPWRKPHEPLHFGSRPLTIHYHLLGLHGPTRCPRPIIDFWYTRKPEVHPSTGPYLPTIDAAIAKTGEGNDISPYHSKSHEDLYFASLRPNTASEMVTSQCIFPLTRTYFGRE